MHLRDEVVPRLYFHTQARRQFSFCLYLYCPLKNEHGADTDETTIEAVVIHKGPTLPYPKYLPKSRHCVRRLNTIQKIEQKYAE